MTGVQVLVETMRDKRFLRQNALFVEVPAISEKCSKNIRKDNEKALSAGDPDKQQTKRTPHKCFRCGSVDNIIDKCPKPPKD